MIENAKYKKLKINELTINAAFMGQNNQDTPILLLHGFPEFHYSYRYLMPILAQKRKVIAIDQRGYNESAHPKKVKNYSIKWLMRDVVEVIKIISPSKKVILVGHDWGGAVSWHVARFYPNMIEKLIILNCPPVELLFKAIRHNPKQMIMSYYIMLFQIPKLPELLFKTKDFSILKKILKDIKVKGGEMSKKEIQTYIKCFNRRRGMSGINYYRAAFRDSILKRYLPKVKVQTPTLVLWGVDDLALHIDLVRHFDKYIEKEKLNIKLFAGTGHFIQQEMPEIVSKQILTFIQSKKEKYYSI
ncbi:MAG: alpha/beta fold hydrolase [Promethearchaeota archaeon]